MFFFLVKVECKPQIKPPLFFLVVFLLELGKDLPCKDGLESSPPIPATHDRHLSFFTSLTNHISEILKR